MVNMTIKKRVIILVIIAIAFLIAAPIVIYYAIGYTFDFEQWRLVKTGILLINTEPKGVQIFLNGKLKSESPARIRFLLPNDYRLELKKDGYMPWEKSITVSAQQITHLNSKDREIYLFLQNPETTLTATSTQKLIQSDPGLQRKVATSTTELLQENLAQLKSPYILAGASLYRVIGGKTSLIQQDVDNAYWVDDGRLLLYANRNNIWMIDPSSGEKSDLIERSQQAIINPQYNSKSGQIFYLQEGNIKTIEASAIFSKYITKIIDEELQIVDFFIDKKGETATYLLENGELWKAKIR